MPSAGLLPQDQWGRSHHHRSTSLSSGAQDSLALSSEDDISFKYGGIVSDAEDDTKEHQELARTVHGPALDNVPPHLSTHL